MAHINTAALLAAHSNTPAAVRRAAHYLVYTGRAFYTLLSADNSQWLNPADNSIVFVNIPA